MNSLLHSPPVMLAVYGLLVFFASLAGGVLPTLLRLTHARLQLAVSFVAGLMLGLALLGLLPHASHELHSVQRGAAWLAAGFLAMFLLQRFLPFHHHDVPLGQPGSGAYPQAAEVPVRPLGWVSVTVGLSLHSIFDGLALAAAVTAVEHGHGGSLGLGTALAVILHKPFGAMAITTLMAASREPQKRVRLINFGFALVTPLGALLFFLGASHLAHAHPAWLGAALAFCAGTFLCIACADLLPELQFHSHDRVKLSLALLAGFAAALLMTRLGHAGQQPAPAAPVAPPPAVPSLRHSGG